MYIVHVPCFVFIIPRYHWCEKWFAYLHCIIWSEQGHIFYILSLLCRDDAVIRFDIVWRKKKHLSIQAWVRVMLLSVCKYHSPVLSLSLFLTCDISTSYMEKQRKEKKKFNKKPPHKTKQMLPLFGAFREALLVMWLGCEQASKRGRERGCAASRLRKREYFCYRM